MRRVEFLPCPGCDLLSFLLVKLSVRMLLPLTLDKGPWGDVKKLSLFCKRKELTNVGD